MPFTQCNEQYDLSIIENLYYSYTFPSVQSNLIQWSVIKYYIYTIPTVNYSRNDIQTFELSKF